jgi:hypothetical protein
MQQETAALLAKSLATGGGAVAAFGLTPVAIAAAIVGAIASLHFEPPASGSTLWRVLGQIAALALLAALLAAFTYAFYPGDTVPLAARAGLLGIFANPCYQWARGYIERKRAAGEPPKGE